MQVKVYFRETLGNDFMIELNVAYFDFTTRDEAKRATTSTLARKRKKSREKLSVLAL